MNIDKVVVGMSVVMDGPLEATQLHFRGRKGIVKSITKRGTVVVSFLNDRCQEFLPVRFNAEYILPSMTPPPVVTDLTSKPEFKDPNKLINEVHAFLCGLGQYFKNDHTDTKLQQEIRDLIRKLGFHINPKMYEIEKRASYEHLFLYKAKVAGFTPSFNPNVETGRTPCVPSDQKDVYVDHALRVRHPKQCRCTACVKELQERMNEEG